MSKSAKVRNILERREPVTLAQISAEHPEVREHDVFGVVSKMKSRGWNINVTRDEDGNAVYQVLEEGENMDERAKGGTYVKKSSSKQAMPQIGADLTVAMFIVKEEGTIISLRDEDTGTMYFADLLAEAPYK